MILIFIFALLLLAWKTARVYSIYTTLRADAHSLIDSSHDDAEKETDQARALLNDYRNLRREFGWLPNLGTLFGWLPRYGADLAAVPQFLNLADALADAAEPTITLYQAIYEPTAQGEAPTVALSSLARQKPELVQQAQASLARARARRAQINTTGLSPETQPWVAQLDEILPAWTVGLRLIERAPVLLGADQPRTYLLLAQNNDELRATGGFISGVGLISFDKGQLSIVDFRDSYAVDDLSLRHPPPPEALQKYMGATQWLVRDANWYADFPTTAQVAQSLYQLDRGAPTDGVIAVDLHLMPLLLRAFGEVNVDAGGPPINAANVITQMQARWSPPPEGPVPADWWEHRKDFMGEVLGALMERLRGGRYERPQLALALWQGLRSKSMLLYLNDVEANSALEEANWDGALAHGDGDHLYVVDSNVGFNKVNVNVTEALTYTVALNDHGGEAALEIAYHNTAAPSADVCDHRPYYGKDYADLQQRCYWDYVRVLVPASSKLRASAGVEDARVVEDLSEVTAFQGYFVLARGEPKQVRFDYTLPPVSTARGYGLTLQKQAGAPARPVHVRVGLPDNWNDVTTNLEPTRRAGNTLDFDVMLDRDQTLTITRTPSSLLPLLILVGVGALLLGGGLLFWRGGRRTPNTDAPKHTMPI